MKTRESIFTSYFPTSLYKFVLMILAAILLSSCALMGRIGNKLGLGLYDDYSIKPLRYDQQYEELLKDVTKSNENPKGFLCKKCWDGSSLDNDEEKALCKYQRNLLIGDLIAISDGMCENHMKTILGNEATVNIITGTFTNAFSGAATVITGAGTKSIFSALAFFSNSERSLVNETIYKSVLVPAIIKKINEIRLNERNTIMKKYEDNKNAAYEDYPVTFALADIIKYHQTCSFMVGLQKALEEGTQPAAGQDRASLEQKLKTLVLEKDNRIRELKNLKAGISDEEINKDKYVIYLNGEIDAITKKLIEPGAKATSKTVVEKLAEKDRELQEARKDYEKRTADLTEAEIRLTQREKEKKKAQEDVDTTKDALGKAMQATDVAKQNELKQQHDRYTAALGKATENFDKASKNKGDAVNAKNDADSRVKKLKEDLDKLEKETKLAEKDRELQEARKDYEKRTADLTEAEIRLTQREKEKKKAQEDVDTAKDALGKAMQATDVAKQNELKQQHDRYTAALGKATENFDKASKNKGDAVNAKNDADSRVKKLEEDLDKLKKEAAETKS